VEPERGVSAASALLVVQNTVRIDEIQPFLAECQSCYSGLFEGIVATGGRQTTEATPETTLGSGYHETASHPALGPQRGAVVSRLLGRR